MSRINVGSLLERRPLVTVSIKTPISEAMELMAKNRITAVCVMRRNKLVGIFTMKDVMTKVLGYKTASIWKTPKKRRIKDVPVRLLMSPEPYSVQKLDSLEHALNLMKKNRIRHLPVMKNDELFGLVTLRDVIEGIRQENMEDKKAAKLREPLESMYHENLYSKLAPTRTKRA